ncbi:MAG TPA: DNA-binding response regulator, partial [Herpetosiphon sp.]|uniref:response regulator transcription factor n=1 Tax=Herpetosiphon sp. TaxID=71864 RepID=UPI000E80A8EA
AWGAVSTDAYPQEIWASLQALQLGLCVLSPSILAQIHSPPQPEPLDNQLSEREHEVLQLLAEGLTNRQIAQRLIISEHTVKFHVSALLGKLDVSSRTEAIRVGAQRGLIIW